VHISAHACNYANHPTTLGCHSIFVYVQRTMKIEWQPSVVGRCFWTQPGSCTLDVLVAFRKYNNWGRFPFNDTSRHKHHSILLNIQ